MSTIITQNELVRRAVEWIAEEKREGKKFSKLMDEAAVRFNLGPRDVQFIEKFFKEENGSE
ncbi:MAG: hypothetical protein ACLFQR_05675 [Desulfovibrionales bacterium]